MTRLIKLLEMGLKMTRAEPGQVKFRSSALTDPHIRMLVNEVAQRTGIPTQLLDAKLMEHIQHIDEMKQYSVLLYETAARNAVENAAFDLIGADDFAKERFNVNTFVQLCNIIQHEHEAFFPLRPPGGGEKKYIFAITPIIVPSPKEVFKKYNSINTAAATENGDFIFNQEFMQKLMNWATMEHAKPTGAKYVSNGGIIPDCYVYIEFLIMHELLHYAYGDMARSKKLKQYKHSTHNQAMDFRINYLLVKSGYKQLPIGLFSDHINYDRQDSYEDMVRIVHEELQKLPKPLRDIYQDIADQMDDHSQSGNATPGSEEAEEQAQAGEEQAGDGDGELTPTEEKIQKDIEDKLAERKEESGKDMKANDKFDPNSRGNGSPGSGGNLDDMTDISDLIKQQKPKYNWRALMKMLIQSAKSHEEPSYTKPHRRAATGMTVAAAMGAGAIKPGPKILQEPTLDLVLVIDTSGSMGSHIPLVLAEAKSLLKAAGKSDRSIMVVFFAGADKYFKVNIAKNMYAEVSTVDEFLDKAMPQDSKTGADDVFNYAGSGGTEFNTGLTNNLDILADKKYNIIIFSDSDLTAGSNWTNMSNLWLKYKKMNNVCFIADSKETWVTACKKIGQIPPTWTYIA